MAENNYSPVTFNSDDFVLVQENARIFDKKLETKPTTFFKDAIRRFVKNKSSVAAAVILAILILMTIFVPIISPFDMDNVKTNESFLAPKLFEAGTGFWDGTRSYKRVVYDPVNEIPAVSDKYSVPTVKSALIKIAVDEEPTLVDARSPYGEGGAIVVETDALSADHDIYMISKPLKLIANGDYKVDIVFSSDTSISEVTEEMPVESAENGDEPQDIIEDLPEETDSTAQLGVYRVYLKYGEEESERIMIRDFGKDYSNISFNISEALQELGVNSIDGQLVFEVKSASNARQYILVESVVFSGAETIFNAEDLAAVSFTDATEMINNADKNDMGYWACSGRKGIHDSKIYYCDYTIDTYMLVYGDADPVTYTKAELDDWIAKGYCTYDHKVGPESFQRLSDECPVDYVDSQTVLTVTGKLSSITARGWNYRKLGYKTMPKFILGTDASGFDLFKRTFVGMRTSLILGVLVAVIVLTFGIVWGSISGYFGGNVDLLMERFTDILGGVPFICVLTLCILHFGTGFGVFLMAFCLTSWIGTAHTTRTQFYRFKGREYVLASRTLGAKDSRLIFRHILPNALGTVITRSVLMVPIVIAGEASYAYIGLRMSSSNMHSFGVMLSSNQTYLAVYPNLIVFPAIIMALMMITFNLFGNGLRDAFNPSLKGSD